MVLRSKGLFHRRHRGEETQLVNTVVVRSKKEALPISGPEVSTRAMGEEGAPT